MRRLFLKSLALLLIVVAGQSFALDNIHEKEEDGKEHLLKNEISLFLGVTSFLEHEGNYFSPGIDYTRRLTEHILIGGWIESVLAEETEWTMGIPLYFTHHHFWIRIAPGIEILNEEKENEQTLEVEQKSKTECLFRSGLGYTFHLSNFLISPSIDYDYVRSNGALVYGINLGYGF